MDTCDCRSCRQIVKAARLEADAYELDSLEAIHIEHVEPTQPRIFANTRGGYAAHADGLRSDARSLRRNVGQCLNINQVPLDLAKMWQTLGGK
jgi:hypothetical protein